MAGDGADAVGGTGDDHPTVHRPAPVVGGDEHHIKIVGHDHPAVVFRAMVVAVVVAGTNIGIPDQPVQGEESVKGGEVHVGAVPRFGLIGLGKTVAEGGPVGGPGRLGVGLVFFVAGVALDTVNVAVAEAPLVEQIPFGGFQGQVESPEIPGVLAADIGTHGVAGDDAGGGVDLGSAPDDTPMDVIGAQGRQAGQFISAE